MDLGIGDGGEGGDRVNLSLRVFVRNRGHERGAFRHTGGRGDQAPHHAKEGGVCFSIVHFIKGEAGSQKTRLPEDRMAVLKLFG